MRVKKLQSNHIFFFLAPSGAPTFVSISDTTSSSITVQWGPVSCINRNGDITGYSVLFGVGRSGDVKIIYVPGGATTGAIISGLYSSTNYSFEVAAVNSAGIGLYSTVMFSLTKGIFSCCYNKIVALCLYFIFYPFERQL